MKIFFLTVLKQAVNRLSRANMPIWIVRVAEQDASNVAGCFCCSVPISLDYVSCRVRLFRRDIDWYQLYRISQHCRYMKASYLRSVSSILDVR